MLALAILLPACGQATTRMQPGVPIEVKRGYCFLSTEYRQRGREVNRNDTLGHLARYERSKSYVSAGNAFAIGSIAATLVATTTLTVGLLGTRDTLKMDDGVSTALIATGIGTGVLSWVLCITSDGKYARAAEVYNEGLSKGQLSEDDEAPSDDPSTDDDTERPQSRRTTTTSEPSTGGY